MWITFSRPKPLQPQSFPTIFLARARIKREKEEKVLLILVVNAYPIKKDRNSLQLNKITILLVPEKTKEALFAGFFRFLFFLEGSFGSLFMLFCMFMQKKGQNKRYRKANKVTGCVHLAEDPFAFFDRLQTYRINSGRFLE